MKARSSESGVALVMTLFLLAALSALSVSLVFLSQTETASSRNYKTMSQARYAGEAGAHRLINYLIWTYTKPSDTGSDPLSNYDPTTTPVNYSGSPVVLSTDETFKASNYPVAAVKTAVNALGAGTTPEIAAGSWKVKYRAYATLTNMEKISVYGGGTSVIQTWEIVSDGIVPGVAAGSQVATVEVTTIIELGKKDVVTYAVFAAGAGCGAISMNGNASTDSYDSSVGPATTDSGGDVGTNGNMTIVGHVDVHGALSSPRTGVGACVDGSGVDALTETGAATVDAPLIKLPQPIAFDAPVLPLPTNVYPPTGNQSTCAQFAVTLPATCTASGGTITIDPMGSPLPIKLGNISGDLILRGGTYVINSIGSGNLTIQDSAMVGPAQHDAIIYLAGRTTTATGACDSSGPGNCLANPFNLNGNAVVNSSLDPTRLQILYGGTGALDMTGGSAAAAMVYAPKAGMTTHGNSDFYGSILTDTLTTAGNTNFHYDRHLSGRFVGTGDWQMTSFSWKKS